MKTQRNNAFILLGEKKHSLLTWTTDMAAWSFSLPAYDACPHKVTGKNSICGSCYATFNRYGYSNVQRAQYARLRYVVSTMKSDYKIFVNRMISEIGKHVKNGYFRVHDSGDFVSPKYIQAWIEICEALPDIKFWFPTRAWRGNKVYIALLRKLNRLANVSIRPSALYFNDKAPSIRGLNKGTTVCTDKEELPKGTKLCPKTVNKGTCESNNCRSCWENDVKVAYLFHGIRGRRVIATVSPKMLATRKAMKDSLVSLTIGVT